LRLMRSCYGGKRFEFNNNGTITNKVGRIGLPQHLTFIEKLQRLLFNIRYPAFRQFFSHALLINRLKKTATHFPIHVKNDTLNLVTLFFIPNVPIHFLVFVPFVFFVDMMSITDCQRLALKKLFSSSEHSASRTPPCQATR
jgi:hypothetical protein